LFNGVPGGLLSFTSMQVDVIVPASLPTTVTVEVVTAGGSASNLSYEYVDAPTISSVSPTQGGTAGGTTVTVNGSSFTSTTEVYFDGTPAASFTVVSATQLTVVTPAGTTGAVDVVVENPGGSATTVGAFTYGPTPTLNGISRSYGPVDGGVAIGLGGSNFVAGATTVSFGGTAATYVSVSSAILLIVGVPAHVAGAVAVTATTANGTSNSRTFNYIDPPTITSITPSSGDWSGGYVITINGTNLTSALNVYFGANDVVSDLTINSDTQLLVTVPGGPVGPIDIAVDTEGGITTAPNGFTYTP